MRLQHVSLNMASHEKRRHERFKIQAPVTLTQRGTIVSSGMAKNVSISGIGLQLYQPVVVGEEYHLDIAGKFSSKIRIAGDSMGYYFGAEFVTDGEDADDFDARVHALIADTKVD